MRKQWIATCLVLGLGCKSESSAPKRTPPPPMASVQQAKQGLCDTGGGVVTDTATTAFFPRKINEYCIDPNGGDKSFGEASLFPIDKICDLFDGECEVYKGYNVRRVVEVRYVDGSGSSATIDIHLSKFATKSGAFAMFTKRIVGDGDPIDEATPKPIGKSATSVLGVGNAYFVKDVYLAEITLNDENANANEIKTRADKILPELIQQMRSKMGGSDEAIASVQLLPEKHRIEAGVRHVDKNVFDIDGLGEGTFGYYKEGDKRYRIVVMLREDATQAQDTFNSLLKRKGSEKEKSGSNSVVRMMIKDGESPSAEWLFAVVKSQVVGIGDEARVLRSGMSNDELKAVTLTHDEKLERLRSL